MTHVLKQYFIDNEIVAAQFCREIGITTTHLQHIYHHKRYPSRELCQKIYEHTEGDVHPMDLLDIQEKE